MNQYARAGIIDTGKGLYEGDWAQLVADSKGPGKFEYVTDSSVELALAVREIVLNGFSDQEGDDGFARVDSILYHEDEQGFVWLWAYDTEEKAEQALVANLDEYEIQA